MQKITVLLVFTIFFLSSVLQADEQVKNLIPLNLTCDISFNNFDNIDHAVTTKDIILTQAKHKPDGMKLVSQTRDYEFWVMTHSVQSIAGQKFVNNFQVAIKHKTSQLFMHALSDTGHSPEVQPEKARISLVDYHLNTTLEKGELIFECHLKKP